MLLLLRVRGMAGGGRAVQWAAVPRAERDVLMQRCRGEEQRRSDVQRKHGDDGVHGRVVPAHTARA